MNGLLTQADFDKLIDLLQKKITIFIDGKNFKMDMKIFCFKLVGDEIVQVDIKKATKLT